MSGGRAQYTRSRSIRDGPEAESVILRDDPRIVGTVTRCGGSRNSPTERLSIPRHGVYDVNLDS
jgi:hypothetical protein